MNLHKTMITTTDIPNLPVQTLRSELRKLGLSASGVKVDLIERLTNVFISKKRVRDDTPEEVKEAPEEPHDKQRRIIIEEKDIPPEADEAMKEAMDQAVDQAVEEQVPEAEHEPTRKDVKNHNAFVQLLWYYSDYNVKHVDQNVMNLLSCGDRPDPRRLMKEEVGAPGKNPKWRNAFLRLLSEYERMTTGFSTEVGRVKSEHHPIFSMSNFPWHTCVLAGGYAWYTLTTKDPGTSDVDLFVIGDHLEQCETNLADLLYFFQVQFPGVVMFYDNRVISLYHPTFKRYVQIIKTVHASGDEVTAHFDLTPTRVYIQGNTIYATPSAYLSTRWNQLAVHHASACVAYRVLKWAKRVPWRFPEPLSGPTENIHEHLAYFPEELTDVTKYTLTRCFEPKRLAPDVATILECTYDVPVDWRLDYRERYIDHTYTEDQIRNLLDHTQFMNHKSRHVDMAVRTPDVPLEQVEIDLMDEESEAFTQERVSFEEMSRVSVLVARFLKVVVAKFPHVSGYVRIMGHRKKLQTTKEGKFILERGTVRVCYRMAGEVYLSYFPHTK